MHRRCFVCGEDSPSGLRARFELADGRISGRFQVREDLQSLPGVTHGGILAALMDAAMAQWLLQNGVVAVTALLQTKFHRSLATGSWITITAWPRPDRGEDDRQYHLKSRIVDNRQRTIAQSEAVFVRYEESTGE